LEGVTDDFPLTGGREDGALLPSEGRRVGGRVVDGKKMGGKEIGGKEGEGAAIRKDPIIVKRAPY
jgi:hypothetical protein